MWAVVGVGLLGSLILTGCSPKPDFSVQELIVEQPSWDSLSIGASFLLNPAIGSESEIVPDIATYTVFNASYDTLYSGIAGTIALDDHTLSDRELLLVEVCGYYLDKASCEQRSVSASPKRVVAEYDVSFPADSTSLVPSFERGHVYVATRLERKSLEDEKWEIIRRPSGKELHVQIHMEGIEGASVRLPITRSETSFNLNRYPGFKDLRYGIRSSLMDADSAVVLFDFYAKVTDPPALVERRRIVLRNKSDEERQSEVRALVERAGVQLLSELSGVFGARRAYVVVNEWSYESLEKGYDAQFELHWQRGIRGEWLDFSGRLLVRDDGTMGTVEFLRGSERAEERWIERIETSVFTLEPLFPERVQVLPDRDTRNPR